MFLLSYYGGAKRFEKVKKSFSFSIHRRFPTRFHNASFARFLHNKKIANKHYRHSLVLDISGEDPLLHTLNITKRVLGVGIFTPHFLKIEYAGRKTMERFFSCGMAFSFDYEIRGSDSKLVHPFLMDNEYVYKDLCRIIREAQEEYMKKLPHTYKLGVRIPRGVVSPFYVLQFRAKKEIEVMFFIGGAVDGND